MLVEEPEFRQSLLRFVTIHVDNDEIKNNVSSDEFYKLPSDERRMIEEAMSAMDGMESAEAAQNQAVIEEPQESVRYCEYLNWCPRSTPIQFSFVIEISF